MINKFYPVKPIIDYKKTSIDFEKFIEFSYNSDYGSIMSLAIIANESAWGKKGVNNNYLGIQVDNAKWGYPDFEKILKSISVKKDNAGDTRQFAVFSEDTAIEDNYDFIYYYVSKRNIKKAEDYYKSWVGLEKPATEQQIKDFNAVIAKVKQMVADYIDKINNKK